MLQALGTKQWDTTTIGTCCERPVDDMRGKLTGTKT